MNKLNVEQLRVVQVRPRVAGGRIGKIVALSKTGVAVVDYPGNPLGPQAARAVSAMAERLREAHALQSAVLLLFEEDDAAKPIIVDVVATARETGLTHTPAEEPTPAQLPGSRHVGSSDASALRGTLGVIMSVEENSVLVRLADSNGTQVSAKAAISLRNLKDPVIVLLLSDIEAVIIAQLYERVSMEPDGTECGEVVLKGSRVRIEADVELLLKAGACTVQLDARGKAVTTANQIVSRARDSNKVQGGSIQLN